MLTRTIGRFFVWPIDRLAALLAPTGIPPNVITWSALILNLWGGILFAAGRFAAAGGMMLLAGLCDLLDGPVARRQNRVSLFGAFLDSIL
ncbi:MAG: CDP-alcohol phosphatidyltransferase family protein, partial [Candidatus Acidiferrales bacterium]